ncbi:MAG: tetratricopeptide repeat protein [Desulfovibrio sp.]|jgi:tetratricopeptide (TPR) repeat protein|nr:tetratricopeptide repeat protein [Desulfovibrio sp.]
MPDITPLAAASVPVSVVFRPVQASAMSPTARRAILPCLLLALLLTGCALPRIGIYEDPLSGPEHLELGRAYEQKGELDLARREYAEAVRDDVPQAHLHLANLLFQKGETEEAETHYRKAIRALPEAESAPARNNLAWLLLTRGEKLEEAERLAEEAVRLADDAHRQSFEDTLNQVKAARNR